MATKKPNPAIREAVSVGEFAGAKEERARIRRAIAPALRMLRNHELARAAERTRCDKCWMAIEAIDAATKPTRPARAKEGPSRAAAQAQRFPCCGGTDEKPVTHNQDCPDRARSKGGATR